MTIRVCRLGTVPRRLSTFVSELHNALSTYECPFTRRAHTHRVSIPLKSRRSNTSSFRPPLCIALALRLPMVSFVESSTMHHTLRRLFRHSAIWEGILLFKGALKGRGEESGQETEG